jgi:ADP-ribosylglycohydrolase
MAPPSGLAMQVDSFRAHRPRERGRRCCTGGPNQREPESVLSGAAQDGSVVKEKERILNSLKGIATGDAVGKQTEGLSRDEIVRWYPQGVHGFEGSPGGVIPRYATNRKRRWLIGETTDDTERTMAVARAVLRDREVRHASVGRELLTCQKSVHPGVKSSWEFHQAGDAARVTTDHNGCGAAIRVAPVGILYRSYRIEDIVKGAQQASISTHGGPLALAAAAATAAAISTAIDGAEPREIVKLAQLAADRAEFERSGSKDTAFAQAIGAIRDDLCSRPRLNAADIAREYFPDNPLTIVPLAIALASVMQSAQAAILLAANIGGDSDSVASVAGAILGARYPETVNDDWYGIVEMVNDHRLMPLGEALSALRS